MDQLLDKTNLEFRERARHIANTVVRPIASELDRDNKYPWAVIEALKKEGLMGVWIPKEYGGLGAGILNLCIVVEELSKACGGVGVTYAVNALGSFPIILGGTEEQKKKYLPAIAAGETLVAFGLSEKESGSDASSLATKAVKEGDEFVINGDKKWNTNGGAATLYTIYCATREGGGPRGLSAIMVEKDTPGFRIGKLEDKMGIRCVPVHELHFENCRVPAENVLGGVENTGFKNAMMTLDRARPGVAAQAVGLAAGALDHAVNWSRERVQFGQPISGFQGIQFMLADMATQVEAARQLVYATARLVDSGEKNISRMSAMSKLFASDVAMKVTTDAVQIFGGYGYVKDYPIEKYMRDAKITQIYEGTNQIQRLVIARNLIKEAASSAS